MATLADAYTLANDPQFINRVSQAVAVAADTVRQEADSVPGHADRLALMRAVVQDVNAYGYRFARMATTNATIAAAAPDEAGVADGDLQYVVNGLWDAFVVAAPEAP
jgi:hypothetical protein